MKRLLFVFILASIVIKSQVLEEPQSSGTITYVSSSQVFVTFESIDGINKGDTLFAKNGDEYIPAAEVVSFSGSSCSSDVIASNLEIDTKIYLKDQITLKKESLTLADKKLISIAALTTSPVIPIEEENPVQLNPVETKTSVELKTNVRPDSTVNIEKLNTETGINVLTNQKKEETISKEPELLVIVEDKEQDETKESGEAEELKTEVFGKVSVQSYSNLSNLSREVSYQRWRYNFRLNANNIGSSKLSYSHYLNFAYRASDWNRISSNPGEALRVYDLALTYDFNNRTSLTAGRHINRKVSNVSIIDGLQFETGVSSWSFGLIAGARPHYRNLGVNLKLFEYGAYIYKSDTIGSGNMANTISYFEQTNDYKTDRRFMYFQHTNSAIKNTRIFLSSEIDLYKKELGISKGDFSLTSLYSSISVRPSDIISFMLSYDARKNVIYYETFNTFADSVYENETRQGFRARVNLRAVKGLYLNGNFGYRYRKGDAKPSRNFGGSITYSQVPFINVRLGINYSKLLTSYIDGSVWGASLSRDILNGANLSIDYRNTQYDFNKSAGNLKQHSVSIGLSLSFFSPVYLGIIYEGVFEDARTSGRVLTNLSYRF